MPDAPVRHVGQRLQAESGQAHLDGGEAADVVGVRGGQPEDGRSADVLPREVDGPDVEVGDQVVQVGGRGRTVVVTWRVAGVAEATQVHGEDPVGDGEQGISR